MVFNFLFILVFVNRMDYKQYYDCVIGPHYQEDTNAMYKIMYVVFGNYKNKL